MNCNNDHDNGDEYDLESEGAHSIADQQGITPEGEKLARNAIRRRWRRDLEARLRGATGHNGSGIGRQNVAEIQALASAITAAVLCEWADENNIFTPLSRGGVGIMGLDWADRFGSDGRR